MKSNGTLYKIATTIFAIIVVYGFVSSQQFALWLNVLFVAALVFLLIAVWK